MCGIFGITGTKNNAAELILEGLRSLEYRGYDSWGVAVREANGKLFLEKHVGKIGEAKLPSLNAISGIGHTRWATHGGVTVSNAHPHVSTHEKVVVVHNGIIENYEELKTDLLKKGIKFASETDTEVVPHLIEQELNAGKSPFAAFQIVIRKLAGMNAIIAYFPRSQEFTAFRLGSPLVFGKTKDELVIASDYAALLPYTQDVYFLEDHDLLHFKKSAQGFEIKLLEKSGQQKELKYTHLDVDERDASLGKYPHYMIKEISEQPEVLRKIVKNETEKIKELAKIIKDSFGTYFIGAGTAYFAALSGTYLFSKIAKKHVNASQASEFSYQEDFITKNSMVMALSQSGETIDIIGALERIREKGAHIGALVNVVGSSLWRLADYPFPLTAGPEKCVLATKSFTAKIALLYLAAHELVGKQAEGHKHLQRAINEVIQLLQNQVKLETIAHRLAQKEHIFIIGRGISYPTALESALKIKEVSYIHAEGFAAGELKHGVIALIEKDTPVLIYNPEDETYADTLSAAHEVKARGAYVIGVSSKPNEVYDAFIEVKNCNDATMIPNVVVAQLIGYYLALARGNDPDKPRNLAKSVTVK